MALDSEMDKAALALIGQAEICLFIVQSFLLVLRRGKRPIDGGPSGIGGALNPFVRSPSGTSKTSRSLLLEVSNSTINKPSEYMILNIPPFCDHGVFVRNTARFN